MWKTIAGVLMLAGILAIFPWLSAAHLQDVGVEGKFVPEELITQFERTKNIRGKYVIKGKIDGRPMFLSFQTKPEFGRAYPVVYDPASVNSAVIMDYYFGKKNDPVWQVAYGDLLSGKALIGLGVALCLLVWSVLRRRT